MKDEVRRILNLVQEGKLSADDAYDLIEAFDSTSEDDGKEEPAASTQPPPPPTDQAGSSQSKGNTFDANKDPFKNLVEAIEKLGKDAAHAVNWQEVAKQAKESANKAAETIRTGFENVRKSGGFGFFVYETKHLSLPLNVPEGKILRIENPCGDIRINGGFDAGMITADAKFRGPGEDARERAESYTLVIEENDSAVIVKQPDVPGLSVDLDVELAGAVSIEIKSESGDVHVSDTKSGCRVSTKSGDVHLKGLNGLVEVSAHSGDLRIEDSTVSNIQFENKSGDAVLRRIVGSANVRTTSGDISVRDSEMKTLAIDGVSGDVDVDLRSPVTGAVTIRTVSGDTLVAIPDGSDCRVGLKTLRGNVTCALPLTEEARAEGQVTGRLGDGKGTLDVSAVNGNITIEMHVSF
ncbi:MAG TPA: DUF4097 family beta strand repeat-containing protein [Fimbriimonadaceae bacterium]|nr:DUF4097 family beta strand repeat-containing protein [Fimbriimonadaceae bacterium]